MLIYFHRDGLLIEKGSVADMRQYVTTTIKKEPISIVMVHHLVGRCD